MLLSSFKSVHRGSISEGVVIALLPNRPYHCAKDREKHYFYDIEWHGIKIEVKGSIYKKGYSFSMPKRYPHQVWHNQEIIIEHVVNPDVYAFVGWNKDDISVWIISYKKLKNKTGLFISDKSRWNKYKLKYPEHLPEEVCRKSGKRFDWMKKQPYETKSR